MTQQEKANFVGVLAEHVVNEVIDDIRSGKIPEEWDGIELRQLLADRFQRAVLKNTLTGEDASQQTPSVKTVLNKWTWRWCPWGAARG